VVVYGLGAVRTAPFEGEIPGLVLGKRAFKAASGGAVIRATKRAVKAGRSEDRPSRPEVRNDACRVVFI
jgi:hypothetical protein